MTSLSVRIDDDPARRAARSVARRVERALAGKGRATMAVSGGSTAPGLFAELRRRHHSIRWGDVDVWQVDERVAPDGHEDRNANQLAALPARLHLMPVTATDLAAAAAEYAAGLPARFDVVHLGVGPDGHTASWPPDDPIVDTDPAVKVALSQPYQGRVRMSLLPAVVNEAAGRVVLVTGADKAAAVAAWVEGAPFDGDLPVARVRRQNTVVVVDRPAASRLETW